MDFIAIDFEIANYNFNSACSLGMVFVDRTNIIDEKYFTIRPPGDLFDPKMTAVHQIPEEILLKSPTFPEIWSEIKEYFNRETLIIAHNAQFDMNVLRNTLIEYDIPTPNFYYACSIPISNRVIKKRISHSLIERTKYFRIQMEQHHNALSDARACAELVIASIKKANTNSIFEFLERYPDINVTLIHEHKLQTAFKKYKNFERVKMSEIIINDSTENIDHPFYNKTVVFTGTLSKIDRKTAMQNVADVGGIPRTTVSKLTNYVVVGSQDLSLVGTTGKSSKQRKAEKLIEEGYDIKIIDEQQFLNLLNYKSVKN